MTKPRARRAKKKPKNKPVGIAKWIADEAEMQEAGVRTMAGIRRFAGECLDGAKSWDIVGRCAVLGASPLMPGTHRTASQVCRASALRRSTTLASRSQ